MKKLALPSDSALHSPTDALQNLQQEIIACRRCPRLVTWCEKVAHDKVKRHAGETYWGKPVPSFTSLDPPKLLIVGLAPAAHGANRTGRMFTGDRSGEWLYRALHKAGFANQPDAVHARDTLRLIDCHISAAAHCAPPDNKPTAEELANCRPYLMQELQILTEVKVIIALGKIAFDHVAALLPDADQKTGRKPAFKHMTVVPLSTGQTLIGAYHPSQQNTFTGRLTEPMFDAVFATARNLLADS